MKPFRLSKSITTGIFLFIVLTCSLAPPPGPAWAQPQKVAILPLTINAEKELTYIQEGISHMLSSRLACKDKTTIISGKSILAQIPNAPQLSDDDRVKAVAGNSSVQYIISGSITEFAGTFSLDTKVYSGTFDAPIQTFFGLADTVDHIIPAMDRIAAEINQKVFGRQTHGLVETDTEKTVPQKDLTRANPETLIPQIPTKMETTEKPFWMFWKKGEKPTYPDEGISQKKEPIATLPPELDEDEETADEKVPFWKFWKKSNPKDEEDEADLEMPEPQEEESTDTVKEDKPFWKIW